LPALILWSAGRWVLTTAGRSIVSRMSTTQASNLLRVATSTGGQGGRQFTAAEIAAMRANAADATIVTARTVPKWVAPTAAVTAAPLLVSGSNDVVPSVPQPNQPLTTAAAGPPGTRSMGPVLAPAAAQTAAAAAAPVKPAAAAQAPASYRVKDALCLFGGHLSSYTGDKDGGCPRPQNTVNSAACSGEPKPNFKCNNLGVEPADPKSLCISFKPAEVYSTTWRCVEKFKDMLFGKLKGIDKAEYEKMQTKIKAAFGAYMASKGANGKTLDEYCQKAAADQEFNQINAKRQSIECGNLYELRDIVGEKIKFETFAQSNRQVPARR
jgi:hypothetical protein